MWALEEVTASRASLIFSGTAFDVASHRAQLEKCLQARGQIARIRATGLLRDGPGCRSWAKGADCRGSDFCVGGLAGPVSLCLFRTTWRDAPVEEPGAAKWRAVRNAALHLADRMAFERRVQRTPQVAEANQRRAQLEVGEVDVGASLMAYG